MQYQFITAILLAFSIYSSPAVADLEPHAAHAPRIEQVEHLQKSLKALRGALVRIGKEKQRDNYTTPISEKSLRLEKSANDKLQRGDLQGAYQQLGLAMDVIKTSISILRNQETLIRSLNFASPNDEYIYEEQRYKGYCLLVDLLIKNRNDTSVIQLRNQAQVISNAAAQQASTKHFEEALKTQEQSNKLMLKAIRLSGVYF
ncbi:MAG: hypothetical protein V7752_09635 [Halopseudomonas sp.]